MVRHRTRARTRRTLAIAVALSSAMLVATGCGVTRGPQSNNMTMLIPNSPGGGYDQTGRAAVAVLENGDECEIEFDPEDDRCHFDLKIVDGRGKSWTVSKVDLCKYTKVTFKMQGGKVFWSAR